MKCIKNEKLFLNHFKNFMKQFCLRNLEHTKFFCWGLQET